MNKNTYTYPDGTMVDFGNRDPQEVLDSIASHNAKTPPKTSLNNQTLEAEIDELVEGIDADWWHDGQVPYELGVVAQSNTHKAIQSLITRECEKLIKELEKEVVEVWKVKDVKRGNPMGVQSIKAIPLSALTKFKEGK